MWINDPYGMKMKGNPRLVGWNFNKNITLNLEDALFTMKSMALMYGALGNEVVGQTKAIRKTVEHVATSTTVPTSYTWKDVNGVDHTCTSVTAYDQNGVKATAFTVGEKYYLTFDVEGADVQEIRISPDRFPGTLAA